MSIAQLFWVAVATGNLLGLMAIGIWWRSGWRWALIFLVGGPIILVGTAVLGLVGAMFVDGLRATKTIPCVGGCGGRLPMRRAGQPRQEFLCSGCERRLGTVAPGQLIDEGGVRIHEPMEVRKL